MKVKNLIKVLHSDTVIAIVDGNSDIKVLKISTLDSSLKERQVHRLYPASSANAYDLYIELKY